MSSERLDFQSAKDAVELYGDKSDVYVSILLRDFEKYSEELISGVENKDLESIKLAAHSMKSIAQQLGITPLSDSALTLENAADQSDFDTCRATYPIFQAYCSETIEFLKNFGN